MSTFLQFYSSIIITVSISVLIFVICSVFFLSSGFFRLLGPIMNPVSESVMYGTGVGIVHGLIMSLVVYWRKPDSMTGIIVSSIYATEILLVIAFVVGFIIAYFKHPSRLGVPTTDYNFQEVLHVIFIIVFWYVVLSIIFLVPSIVIGIINKIALNFFQHTSFSDFNLYPYKF